MMAVFISCEKEDESLPILKLNQETILGKWMVSNASIYKSFEFIDGGVCILVEKSIEKSINEDTVRVGRFEIDDLGRGIIMLIELGDSRILDDILLTSETASFTITNPADPDNVVAVVTERAEEIDDTENTKLLAKSWVLWNLQLRDIENPHAYNVEIPEGYREIVAFSISGTYTKFFINNGVETRKYGNWMWLDDTEEDIRVWDNNQFSGDATQYFLHNLNQNALWLWSQPPHLDGLVEIRYYKLEPSGYYW